MIVTPRPETRLACMTAARSEQLPGVQIPSAVLSSTRSSGVSTVKMTAAGAASARGMTAPVWPNSATMPAAAINSLLFITTSNDYLGQFNQYQQHRRRKGRRNDCGRKLGSGQRPMGNGAGAAALDQPRPSI